ncbi:hypothetical protein F4779DRAFT_622955 [Xylariaceae sp. FL0662B]|nr:hypothetical protein F4779DRAFT_622955 [Xylariaceae sp. FL0662B]
MTSRGKTVEDYGLVRRSAAYAVEPSNFSFILPYLGSPVRVAWEANEITDLTTLINRYGVSVARNAYVTFNVRTTEDVESGGKRLTDMLYKDMIIDNYRAARGDPKTLRFLGVYCVINEGARKCIERAFDRAGKDIGIRGQIEITLGTESYEDCVKNNVFVGGIRSLLLQRPEEIGGAFIKRFVMITEGWEDDSGMASFIRPVVHMVAELARPGGLKDDAAQA